MQCDVPKTADESPIENVEASKETLASHPVPEPDVFGTRGLPQLALGELANHRCRCSEHGKRRALPGLLFNYGDDDIALFAFPTDGNNFRLWQSGARELECLGTALA